MGEMKNYSKMYTSSDVEDEVSAPEVVETEPPAPPMTGVVVDCTSLNVREEPCIKAVVLTTIRAGTEVQVNVDEMLDEWYHVYTATGLDGFCMKKYIAFEE